MSLLQYNPEQPVSHFFQTGGDQVHSTSEIGKVRVRERKPRVVSEKQCYGHLLTAIRVAIVFIVFTNCWAGEPEQRNVKKWNVEEQVKLTICMFGNLDELAAASSIVWLTVQSR